MGWFNTPELSSVPDITYLFPPFKNKVDIFIMALSILWTGLVIWVNITSPVSSADLATVSNVLSVSLGFLLPLYLSNCIQKNREGMRLFEAYCGDIIGLAWQVRTYSEKIHHKIDKTDNSEESIELQGKIFTILKNLPYVIKHIFRDDYNYNELVELKNGKYKKKSLHEFLGRNQKKEEVINTMMFQLVRELRHVSYFTLNDDESTLKDAKKDYESIVTAQYSSVFLTQMMKKWNDIYASYGASASIVQYKEPAIFIYVMYSALIVYIGILPFSFEEKNQYSNMVNTLLIVYFFLSLKTAGQLLQNPFVELSKGSSAVFATVTETAKRAENSIETIRTFDEVSTKSRIKSFKYF